ncbi:GNAT family N-acetyltransferase [Lyngbya aestuarii]|uniref:GNAT family N-acetyltransferase n=1 Tax=Lyngbya aestuarii TaxID=118322 RepID=UPI00403D6B92
MPDIELRFPKNQQELEDMYYQRWLVLRKPLGMEKGSERDKHDNNALHLVAIDNDRVIGSARLRELSDNTGSIAYVAVLSEFRNQGIGTKLITRLLDQAHKKNLKSVRLMARIDSLGFYNRLSFSRDGEPFDFLGLPHTFMSINLPLFRGNG